MVDLIPAVVRRASTFVMVVVDWVIFRSTEMVTAETLLCAMFSWQRGGGIIGVNALVGMLCLAAPLAHLGPNTFELRHEWSSMAALGMALLFGLSVFVVYDARQALEKFDCATDTDWLISTPSSVRDLALERITELVKRASMKNEEAPS